MKKRAFEDVKYESGNPPVQSKKYGNAQSIIEAARSQVDDISMSTSSVASSRRSSVSSEGVSSHLNQIDAFKGDTFSSARNFMRSGASAPLHPVNYPSSTPLPRPESSGGVTAKVQSLLDGFSQQIDVKIDSKLKPLASAQEAAKVQATALNSKFMGLGSSVSTQLSEQDEKNARRNKKLDERIMRGVKEITDGQSLRISHVSMEIKAAQSSITELTGEQAEIRAELSQARKEAIAKVASATKFLTENLDQLKQELEARIDSTVHDAKHELGSRISESSSALDKKIDSNIEAVQSLSSDINIKVEGMKKDLVNLEERFEAETGAIKKSLENLSRRN